MALPYLFEFWALPHQLPPEGDWRTWVIMGGRGAGKTRAGAEWVRSEVEGALPLDAGRSARVALVGETIDQVREVMVFGDSGILACSPPDRRPEWQATRRRLVWPNGAVAQVFSAHEPEGLRGPQFDAAWVDEYGCAAIDKGTNQPNKFLDPKSSESQLPYFSTGRRDDFLQMQYLRAVTSFYASSANNPDSSLYDGPMVDMARAHVWAWDARPYPHFPGLTEVWSDGDNYGRGHWMNGRGGSRSLAGVVAEVCGRAGVAEYDVSGLWGLLRGYMATSADTGRAELQTLMLAYGFDAVERQGVLAFRSRDGVVSAEVAADGLAVSPEAEADIVMLRAPGAETAGRLRLSYVESNADYETRAAEAVFPDEATQGVAGSELPLVLTATEARGIAERWLAEARVARDTAKFSLPPSRLAVGAGDVVRLPSGAGYRVDRVEMAEYQILEAVRVEPELYAPSDAVEEVARPRPFAAPVPVYPLFLDLPLLRGDEVPHAPHVAATARPWPGTVAVYDSASDEGYGLNLSLASASVIGETQTALAAAAPGMLNRGAKLRVRLVKGALSSASVTEMLNGANAAAIGDGSSGNWEVFQFADATLVDTRTWEIGLRLRGQAGTDGIVPEVWPAGSSFVLLDGTPRQIDLALSNRGLARHYRIGPAQRGYDDPSFVHLVEAFDGIGLRPYAPVHLRWVRSGGDDVLTWVRRTRIDGDSWQSAEVPLAEESEAYAVRVRQGGGILREVSTVAPSWTYSAAARAGDGVAGSYEIEVAQVSAQFGPGPFRRIVIDG
ncbi:phage tail protein [Psychromarinibacter sp. S121]|uniref:phage tail protein n=1 Tax=Psychromarinibacter sp. S121 TaxID=3415127 RepID=UPI003C79F781